MVLHHAGFQKNLIYLHIHKMEKGGGGGFNL